MLILILILISLAAICGSLAGLVTWAFASVTTALFVAAVTSLLAFIGLFYLAVKIASERTPEDAVEEMCDWLSSPLEFGKRPDSCEVVYDAEVPWPLDGTSERVFLCRYSFADKPDNDVGIGFVGPTTFSFHDLDLDALKHEGLVQCYRGLHLLMLYQTTDKEQDDLTAEEWKQISEHLNAAGFDTSETNIELGDSQVIRSPEDELLFSIQVKKDGNDVIVVGDFGNLETIETRKAGTFDVAIAHYHWIGSWWSAKFEIESATV